MHEHKTVEQPEQILRYVRAYRIRIWGGNAIMLLAVVSVLLLGRFLLVVKGGGFGQIFCSGDGEGLRLLQIFLASIPVIAVIAWGLSLILHRWWLRQTKPYTIWREVEKLRVVQDVVLKDELAGRVMYALQQLDRDHQAALEGDLKKK